MSKSIQLTIQTIIQETPDTKSFQFISPVPIYYKAGQYLTFVFDQHGSEARRSFFVTKMSIDCRRKRSMILALPTIDKRRDSPRASARH